MVHDNVYRLHIHPLHRPSNISIGSPAIFRPSNEVFLPRMESPAPDHSEEAERKLGQGKRGIITQRYVRATVLIAQCEVELIGVVALALNEMLWLRSKWTAPDCVCWTGENVNRNDLVVM